MLFVSYLGVSATDEWEKAERYASQLNATIARFDTKPVKEGKALTLANKLLRKGN